MSEAPQRKPVSSECHEHCQYAMDVGIPEYSCTNGCMYAARGVEQRNRDIIRRARQAETCDANGYEFDERGNIQ